MFGIGMPEMILLLAVALIVIGPKKLPELAKSLGRAFGEFRRATDDLKHHLELDGLDEVRRSVSDVGRDIKDSVSATTESLARPQETPYPPGEDPGSSEEVRETAAGGDQKEVPAGDPNAAQTGDQEDMQAGDPDAGQTGDRPGETGDEQNARDGAVETEARTSDSEKPETP